MFRCLPIWNRYQRYTRDNHERIKRANYLSKVLRLCPRCQVPIERYAGCNHMHCVQCTRDFFWHDATPLNIESLENTGDGTFRHCPCCKYQNKRYFNQGEEYCLLCQEPYDWDEAKIVAVALVSPPPKVELNPVLKQWITDYTQAFYLLDKFIRTGSMECPICYTREQSFMLACGHAYCGECIRSILKHDAKCPIDRDVITRMPYYREGRVALQ